MSRRRSTRVRRAAVPAPARAVLERAREIEPRRLQGGHEPKHDRRERADDERERHDARIDVRRCELAQRAVEVASAPRRRRECRVRRDRHGDQHAEQRRRPPRESPTRRAAVRRCVIAAGAGRDPNRDLAAAGDGASEQQSGDVGAGRAAADTPTAASSSSIGDRVVGSTRASLSEMAVADERSSGDWRRLGSPRMDRRADAIELEARALDRDAGAQTADDADEVLIGDEIVGVADSRRRPRWHQHLRASGEPDEAARKHADDRERYAVHADRLPDDRWSPA